MTRRIVALAAAVILPIAACSRTTEIGSDGSDTTAGTVDTTAPSPGSTDDAGSTDPSNTATASTATTVATTLPPTTTKPASTTKAPTTTKATTTTVPSGPTIEAAFSPPAACPAVDVSFVPPPIIVKVTWNATNADSIYVAIDNPDGPFEQNLPLSGSFDLPFSCPGPHTMYVVAVSGSDKIVAEATF
jgi:hypothetical protein